MTYRELVYSIADKLTKVNLLGVVVSSLWVLSNSGFISIGPVLVIMLLYQFLIPILVFPSTIFSNFMIFFNYKKRYRLEKLFMALSMSWLSAALSLWVALIFHYAIEYFSKGLVEAGAMWGASMAMATLFLWSGRDRNNPFVATVIEVMQLAVIALAVYKIYNPELSFWSEFGVLFSIMFGCSGFAMLYESRAIKRVVPEDSSEEKEEEVSAEAEISSDS